jgi:hypothetical protein
MATLVEVRRFHGMGAVDSPFLRSDSSVRMQHSVPQTTDVHFRRFWGDVRREFMQRLSVALHGTLGSYLRDAFLWHAFMFFGPRFFPLFIFLLGGLCCFFF